jgi:hypothetical protein
MTKSDRQRLLEALSRHEARYYETREATDAGPFDGLLAAVDWIRAEYRLVERFLDSEDENGWLDTVYSYISKAENSVARNAMTLADEIRKEVEK